MPDLLSADTRPPATQPERSSEREAVMWDTVVETTTRVSHEMPCPTCGHATHRFLACSDHCDCSGRRPSYGDGALTLVLD